MKIDFSALQETVIEHFKGGEGTVSANMFTDAAGKIMKAVIHPDSSIGMHTHETNFEIIYVISGTGKAVVKNGEEMLTSGAVHYCPCGASHELINTGCEDLVLFCCVPESK